MFIERISIAPFGGKGLIGVESEMANALRAAMTVDHGGGSGGAFMLPGGLSVVEERGFSFSTSLIIRFAYLLRHSSCTHVHALGFEPAHRGVGRMYSWT